jgi:hypothetical protein
MQALGAMLGQKNNEVNLLSECVGAFVTSSKSVVDRFAVVAVRKMRWRKKEADVLGDPEALREVVKEVKLSDARITGDPKLDALICQLFDALETFTKKPEEAAGIPGPPEGEPEGPPPGPTTTSDEGGKDDGDGTRGPRSRTVFPPGAPPVEE